jgi:hypothetical protein
MKHLVLAGAIFPLLILNISSHQLFASSDPKHCHRYNECFTIGYRDGYYDAQNGISPAYVCVGQKL